MHGRVSSCLGPLRQSPVLVPCASPVRWSRVDASPPNDRRIFVKTLRYPALVPCSGSVCLHDRKIAEFLQNSEISCPGPLFWSRMPYRQKIAYFFQKFCDLLCWSLGLATGVCVGLWDPLRNRNRRIFNKTLRSHCDRHFGEIAEFFQKFCDCTWLRQDSAIFWR